MINSTVQSHPGSIHNASEPSGFNSLGIRSHLSLGYMTLTHEIRVQFPARDPCFRQPSTPLF